MTNHIESQTTSSLHTLRDALEQAERQLARLDGSNIKTFLVLLDQIEQMFIDLGPNEEARRAEAGRWTSLLNRLDTKPQPLLTAAAHAGGLAKLRAQNPPAIGPWWHVDTEVAHRRTKALKRTGLISVAVVAVVALAWWGINVLTPAAGSAATTTTQIEELVAAQQFPAALAAVEKARQTSPNDPELLVWEAVLHEKLGDTTHAQTSLAQAQEKFVGQPAAFWTLVGNHRQQVGNLSGAEQAGQQALTLAPQDADATFLLGSVAEARGDTVQAATFFSKTATLAGNTNPQLSAIAKVRLGNLAQRVEPGAGAPPVPSMTRTVTQTLP